MYSIADLEYERAGYELRGLKDRVAQVDVEIKRLRDLAKKRGTADVETAAVSK